MLIWVGPRSVSALQRAVRLDDAKSYQEYAELINGQADGTIIERWTGSAWGAARS